MAVQGRGRWEVTALAPARLAGDLREVALEPIAGEACTTHGLQVRLGRIPHLRRYERRLRTLLAGPWDVVHVWEEPYVAACAQVAAAAPPGARVVPATFQNIVKSYPPPLGYFERSVMRRAAGWIAFGETVHEAQAAKPLYAARPVAGHLARCRRRRFRPDAAARAAVRSRLGWSDDMPVVGLSRAVRAGKGPARADAGARRRRSAVARALRRRRTDGRRPVGVRRRPSRTRARADRCRPRRRARASERDGSAVRAEPDDAAAGASSSAGC